MSDTTLNYCLKKRISRSQKMNNKSSGNWDFKVEGQPYHCCIQFIIITESYLAYAAVNIAI